MLDAKEITSAEAQNICIVGSGPAGMVLALELAQKGCWVTLVESGFESPRADIQRLSDACIQPSTSHAPMGDAVARRWGGTGNLWGGRCVPYDPIDFLKRAEFGTPGWPMDFESLAPHWIKACEYADCGTAQFSSTEALEAAGPLADGFVDGSVRSDQLERWSGDPVFARRIGNTVRNHPRIQVRLGWSAVGFRSEQDGRVRQILLRGSDTSAPGELAVDADAFVIACGGVESTRLLLQAVATGQVCAQGHAHLGKYYMGHMSGKIASIQLKGAANKTRYAFETSAGRYVRRRLTFTQEALVANGLLNIALWLDNPPPADAGHRSGILSAAYLAMRTPIIGKRLAPAAIRKALVGGHKSRAQLRNHAVNVLRDLPAATAFSLRFAKRRYFESPRLPGFFVYSRVNRYALHYHAEQSPNPKSTISLGAEADTLGMPRAVVSLQFQQQDAQSVLSAHEKLDDHLRANDIGHIDYWHRPEDRLAAVLVQARDGFHQLGTIRMASSHTDGVADEWGRIFGSPNLFVCSSALFPTSGQANPTLTLIAFALRQAAHLATRNTHAEG